MAAAAVIFLVAGCGGGSAPPGTRGGRPAAGGSATYALEGSGPDYIFPLYDAAHFSVANTADFQALMYRPLYWFGQADGTAELNPALSLAEPPVYSLGNRVVTIKLKDYKWSDGVPVTARDVLFWQNLVTAEKANWGGYITGEYPDNIVSTKVVDSTTIQFTLDKPYDSTWFTYNELSQITPLPQHAWDRISAGGPVGDYDSSPATAASVYGFLDGQARQRQTYATNPLWQVVDGPWKLASYDPSTGDAAFVPNPAYSGSPKPSLDRFQLQVFRSGSEELNALLSGGGPQVGQVSPLQAAGQTRLAAIGYSASDAYSYSIAFSALNYDNPTAGPLFKQTYLRQALQMLIDEQGIIKDDFAGDGYTTCGPVPTEPANPFADSYENSCPYAYDPTAAASLLQAHGWKVVPGGTSTCSNPGTGPDQCGEGIAAGQALQFNYLYPSGSPVFDLVMQKERADAQAAGVVLDPQPMAPDLIDATARPCPPEPACSWQIAYTTWPYMLDFYPTGDTLFATGAQFNIGSYSDPKTDAAVKATLSPGNSQENLDTYQDQLTDQVPVLWQPQAYSLVESAADLGGVTPVNPFGYLTPENWYWKRTKS